MPIAVADSNGNNIKFDNAYWLHQPTKVQALRKIDDYQQRQMAAMILAEQGFLIDNSIMVWGWDPFKIMEARVQYGYTSVPAAMQPNVVNAPGVNGGTGNTGSIKVSLDFDDYPPFVATAVANPGGTKPDVPGNLGAPTR